MEEEDQKELQLLPTSLSIAPSSSQMLSQTSDSSSPRYGSRSTNQYEEGSSSSVDLQLSISLRPTQNRVISSSAPICGDYHESLKWQAAEQIRLAAMEKAYAERVRELTKREMEMARSEFARATNVWKTAKEDVEKAEKMKETATLQQIDSTCMEITCPSCNRRFRP